MKVCACFLLFAIFGLTQTSSQENPQQNPRSVNLALETVLEFREKDKTADLKFLDDVQDFISKVKTVIDKTRNTKNQRRDFKTTQAVTFTGFIQDIIQILLNYEDKAFKVFFDILDDEARKYHYRGCKFHELTDNLDTRKFLASKLDLIKGKPVVVVKAYISLLADALRKKIDDDRVKELVDYINSFYTEEAKPMFLKVFTDVERHSKSNKKDYNDIVKVIRDGLKSTIFDHYSRLHPNARSEIKNKIETFWKSFKTSTAITTDKNVILYSKFVNNVKSDSAMTEKEKPVNTVKEYIVTTHKKVETTKKADRIFIKDSDYKKRIIMRDGLKDNKKGSKSTRMKSVNIPVNDKEVIKPTTETKQDREQRAQYKKSTDYSRESSLSDKSVNSNSVAFSQELQKEFNTIRYMTLYPEAISRRPTTKRKKNKKIVHRAVKETTGGHTLQTLWIEESTGRIPKSVLDKLNTKNKTLHKKKSKTIKESKIKKKHSSKYNKKIDDKSESEFEKSLPDKFKHPRKKFKNVKKTDIHTYKHANKHEVIHDKKVVKHGIKHRKIEYHKTDAKRHKLDNKKRLLAHNLKPTNEEFIDYKKMMGPVTVEYKPEMTITTKTNKTRVHNKTMKTTKPPLPPRNKLKTNESISKLPAIPPRVKKVKVPRKLEPLQKATIFTRKPTKTTLVTLPIPKDSHLESPGKQYKYYNKRQKLSSDELTIEELLKSRLNKERSFRKSNDPSLLKRISALEKELKDVKSRLSNNTVGVTLETSQNALNVTQKSNKPDLKTHNTLGPFFPIVMTDNVKLTRLANKNGFGTEFKEKENVLRENFDTDNTTVQDDTAYENMTNISTKINTNSEVNMNAEENLAVTANYDSGRDSINHNDDEVDVWKDDFKFEEIKTMKSTTTGITKPKNTVNSTITVKPALLATPVNSPMILNATPFTISDAKKGLVSSVDEIKNVSRTTLLASDFGAETVQSSNNFSNATTIYTVANKNPILRNTTTDFGATFYRTIETTYKEEDSTPYTFYRRLDDKFMQGLTDLENFVK